MSHHYKKPLKLDLFTAVESKLLILFGVAVYSALAKYGYMPTYSMDVKYPIPHLFSKSFLSLPFVISSNMTSMDKVGQKL